MAGIGIYVKLKECLDEVPKIRSLVFNRNGILTTNEYLLNTLWCGGRFANFEPNLDTMDFVKPVEFSSESIKILIQTLLGNIDELLPSQIDTAFLKLLKDIFRIDGDEL